MKQLEAIVNEYTDLAINTPTKSIFEVETANKWILDASKIPSPKQLFGSLWNSGELSVLFADTGVGKTILAMQIADCVTTGRQWLPFTNESEAQKLLYTISDTIYR